MKHVVIETIQKLMNGEYANNPIPTFSHYDWDYFMCDERINPTISCRPDYLEYAVALEQGIIIARFATDRQRKFYVIQEAYKLEQPERPAI